MPGWATLLIGPGESSPLWGERKDSMALYTKQEEVMPSRQTASRARPRRRWTRYSARTFFLFVSPWVIGFLVLTLFPLVYALGVSFTDFDGMSAHWHWIGLANYAELLTTPDTWYSLSRTLLYTVIAVPLSVAGGLGLAILLNQRLRAVGF